MNYVKYKLLIKKNLKKKQLHLIYNLNKKDLDPIVYINQISKTRKYNSVMVKKYVNWELSMITVQGLISELISDNILAKQ